MFDFFKKSLKKTTDSLKKIIPHSSERIEKSLLEEALIEADFGYDLTEELLEEQLEYIEKDKLKKDLIKIFPIAKHEKITSKPLIELIIGVNGAGKTTTIAKLAYKYKQDGQSVILGAGDTFRAAAIEQLKAWSEKINVPIIYTKQGHDPSAVAYDTISSAKAKNMDRVIIDTAGRLHTQQNLANELKKIVRISQKAAGDLNIKKYLILDGTQGTSAINQAKEFNEFVGIDGIIITKLDGTAKGGAVFTIARELKLPILYVGLGERAEDLVEFNPEFFTDSFLLGIFD